MQELTTVNSPWTDLAKLYGVDSLSMIGSEEELLHDEDSSKHLDWEGSSWLAIPSMVDDQAEVVDLQQETEIDERPSLA